ncbi:MAG TPA: PIN domain-containing protein [Candidatus Paceibacterota bacterium]|nr:PIN domain-containing protein [Candidatus Paceibacterota bacterium]HRZ57089.1 PIN domain-containing protein [Candidatus Paceibacterota bacterium]
MIAADTQLLVYAHREDSEFHVAAKELVESLRQQPAAWAIPWPCLHEFIAIATHPGIYKPACTLAQALGFAESLLAAPQLHLLSESPGYFEKLRDISTAARLKGPRIHDARIAALCLHHGVHELWSADRDFSAFPQLKVRNPLVKLRKSSGR